MPPRRSVTSTPGTPTSSLATTNTPSRGRRYPVTENSTTPGRSATATTSSSRSQVQADERAQPKRQTTANGAILGARGKVRFELEDSDSGSDTNPKHDVTQKEETKHKAKKIPANIVSKMFEKTKTLTRESPESIPDISIEELTAIVSDIQSKKTEKVVETACAVLTVFCKKAGNAQLISKSCVVDILGQLSSTDPLVATLCPFFYLRFISICVLSTNMWEQFMIEEHPQMSQYMTEIMMKANSQAQAICGKVLSMGCNNPKFVGFCATNPQLIKAAVRAFGPETSTLSSFLQVLCGNPELLNIMISESIVEKIALCIIKPELLISPSILIILIFVASAEGGARRLERSGLAMEIMRTFTKHLDKMENTRIALLLKLLGFVALKQRTVGTFEEEDGFNLMVLFEKAPKESYINFIDFICAIKHDHKALKYIAQSGIIVKCYVYISSSEELQRFIKPLRNVMVCALRYGAEITATDEFSEQVKTQLQESIENIDEWRWAITAMNFGVSKPIRQSIFAGIVGSAKNTRQMQATIYTAALIYAIINPDDGVELAEHVPKIFITTLLGNDAPFEPERASKARLNKPLPVGSPHLAEIVTDIGPNALLGCMVGATLSPHASGCDDSTICARVSELWSRGGPGSLDLPVCRCLSRIASGNRTLAGEIKAEGLVGPISRCLVTSESLSSFVSVCNFITALVIHRDNKHLFATDAIYRGMKFGIVRFPETAEASRAVYGSLWTISTDPTGKRLASEHNFLEVVIHSMTRYIDDEKLEQSALKSLWTMILVPENRELAFKSDGIPAVMLAATSYPQVESIQKSSLTCLKIFSQVPTDECGEQIINTGAFNYALKACVSSDPATRKNGLQAVYSFFGLRPVQMKLKVAYDSIWSLVNSIVEKNAKPDEELILALKIMRVFASGESTWRKLVEDKGIESILQMVKRFRRIPNGVTDSILRVFSKILPRSDGALILGNAGVVDYLIDLFISGVVSSAETIEEFTVKLLFGILNAQPTLLHKSSADISGVVQSYIKSATKPALMDLAHKIASGNLGVQSGFSGLDFPRTTSRADF